MQKYDFLIIGAGIVGLSVAKQLTEKFPHHSIAILEKENNIGRHASGRNSGVLHSGIYYPKDSLKAKVCATGAKKMMAFAEEHHIPYVMKGKIILAHTATQMNTINVLLENAASNNISAQLIDEKTIKELEPYANHQHPGLLIPHTANIDSQKVLNTLYQIIHDRRVHVYLGEQALAVKNQTLTTSTHKNFSYGYLFNCAGANTDKIAKLFNLGKEYTLLPFKGIYFKLPKEKSYLVNSNIYPAPDLNLPFLGVHFTKTIQQDIYVGPTAIPAFGRENYGLIQGVSREVLRIIKDISLMYFYNHQHFRQLIHTEIKKYFKQHFLYVAQQLVPSIQSNDLLYSNKVGIRPQLINIKKRRLEMDYIIEKNQHSIHVLNAISPAFTSAFAFAELLVNHIQTNN